MLAATLGIVALLAAYEPVFSALKLAGVVTASGNALSPRVAAFRDWLLTEAQYSPA